MTLSTFQVGASLPGLTNLTDYGLLAPAVDYRYGAPALTAVSGYRYRRGFPAVTWQWGFAPVAARDSIAALWSGALTVPLYIVTHIPQERRWALFSCLGHFPDEEEMPQSLAVFGPWQVEFTHLVEIPEPE